MVDFSKSTTSVFGLSQQSLQSTDRETERKHLQSTQSAQKRKWKLSGYMQRYISAVRKVTKLSILYNIIFLYFLFKGIKFIHKDILWIISAIMSAKYCNQTV